MIAITGGVGFIGYHVTRALLARGDDAVVLDDFSDAPYPRAEKRRNAADLRAEFPRVKIVEGCVSDRATVGSLLDGAQGVIHLAGLAGVRPSFADPARYARVNVEGTATVLDVARERGINRVVFASSSSVYGNSTPLPAREDAPALAPESPYAATKRSAELVASAMCRRATDMRCAGLRFFTVYGPRQRPEMAITLFTRAVLAGRSITVFGDGSMRRDFTHIDDIVRGVLGAYEKTPVGFRPYNLGSGAPVDLHALVEGIRHATGMVVTVIHGPMQLGDVDATFADITRAREELGWAPRIVLADGLRTVVDWVTKHP